MVNIGIMPRKPPRQSLTRRKALTAGYRSGIEHQAAKIFDSNTIAFEYETIKLKYSYKTTKRFYSCACCGSKELIFESQYLPDFYFTGKSLIYEFKGEWKPKDRKKQIAVQQQNPEYEIVIIFQDPNKKISKLQTYGSYATKNGLKWFALKDKAKWLDYIKKKAPK